ncbi:MAG: protein-L-isoaspartate O-methyltransferase [Candidatus Pacebacteria bacterium]|nr:protein-L-isoaspartate O-methyltransferase [Candidatus Paceibacterota bacterium]MDD4830849.1 protein-L-isoaspartate O-methyltransferase [Candidatus Paceibacterota bacterium]MDD4875082.1 protein-L-isoaspartate O-methyltransferase [Candidatus Paceibacterota bacterium]
MSLIKKLIEEGYLKTPIIIEAFREIKRSDFLPENIRKMGEGEYSLAEADEALPIGFGQTISQPAVVAFMLELLSPKPGEKILDIGSGSGWTTALLSYIVSRKNEGGKVIAFELVPELAEKGNANVSKYNFIEKGVAKMFAGDGTAESFKYAPFDKILASASAKELPEAWISQIKVNGNIVMPIGSSIWRFTKISETEVKKEEFPGFIFVPLITKDS